jgi:hypothetical protein
MAGRLERRGNGLGDELMLKVYKNKMFLCQHTRHIFCRSRYAVERLIGHSVMRRVTCKLHKYMQNYR